MNEVKDRTEWTAPELAAEIASIIRERIKLWNQELWFGNSATKVDELRAALEGDGDVCGTTGCVAGWATALVLPKGARIEPGGDVRLDNGLHGEAAAIGAIALDLDEFQSNWLFASYRTKAEVLAALDAIAEGRDWSPADFNGIE